MTTTTTAPGRRSGVVFHRLGPGTATNRGEDDGPTTTSGWWQGARDRFLRDNKDTVDRLAARQLQTTSVWSWQDDDHDDHHHDDDDDDAAVPGTRERRERTWPPSPRWRQWLDSLDPAATTATTLSRAASSSATPRHVLSGCLHWRHEYVTVHCRMRTVWQSYSHHHDDNDDDDDDPADALAPRNGRTTGRLSCRVTCWATTDQDDHDQPSPTTNARIRHQIQQRLSHDDYVAKLLRAGDDDEEEVEGEGTRGPRTTTTTSDRPSVLVLCEGHVRQYVVPSPSVGSASPSPPLRPRLFRYEERVDTNPAAAEGLRRAVWSHASSVLDVFDLLLHLPWLPTIEDDHDPADPTVTRPGTLLANRVRARLLEDAMVDACEDEGEDEILQELQLTSPSPIPPPTTAIPHHPAPTTEVRPRTSTPPHQSRVPKKRRR